MARDEAFYEAEKEIEAARRSGATELDLSDMGITELPPEIWKLTSLKVLNLGYGYHEKKNQLTQLPGEIGQLTQLQSLKLSSNQLTVLPESLGQLTQLQSLDLSFNQLRALPDWLGNLTKLQSLKLRDTQLAALPESMRQLTQLQSLNLSVNQLTALPEWIGNLTQLQSLDLSFNQLTALPKWLDQLAELVTLNAAYNKLTDLPTTLARINKLSNFILMSTQSSEIFNRIQAMYYPEYPYNDNPLNPELAAAYDQGLDAVMAYLCAKDGSEIVLNEAKLILVGEGGVGKTSLLAALRGDEWVKNRATTHGVEVNIRSLVVEAPDNGSEITLNGWDFGGQNIYRHTHQLFFTAPAVYLAVWEPRRGPEQCRVAEWIKMVKHRAYNESRPAERPRILVVATHGGPKERLDHIDEQALRDEFGDLICGFYHIDSKPDENGVCYQLDQLIAAIGREAAAIPSVGRKVPLSWKKVLEAIRRRSEKDPYITYKQFRALCNRQKVSNELAATYAVILNELGHLIYYRGDDTLKDTVILKPDYLSKAVSFVLEDKSIKEAHGLIEHDRLCDIWHDPARPEHERYPQELHPVFLRLMQRFDLSYQVVMPEAGAPPTSLMAQLVPGIRPDGWQNDWVLKPGDTQRAQVCRVLDAETGRTVEAEGLMYRLIVRLHRYSLGRKNYHLSRHWKNGMILDDGYNGRAFIEEIAGDVYVTVRAAYPERFLHQLCAEVKWLVDHFWKGLDARLFVPCPAEACKGLLELGEIMDFKRAGMPMVRCAVCKQFHEIDSLMATMQPKPKWGDAVAQLRSGQRYILQAQDIGFGKLSTQLRVLMSQADEQYEELLIWLSDPAKDGPRLFSFEPANRSIFDPRGWTRERFRLTLWCEHAKLPLPYLDGTDSKKGIYEIELTRDWFKKAAPFLKVLTGTLSLVLPVASSAVKLAMDDAAYKDIANQLDFGQDIIDASLGGSEKIVDWLGGKDATALEHGEAIRAQGSILRDLHALLKAKDPGFGGLVRVQNKRREFLWVHEQFVGEY